ncbi:hypothetical protein FDG75_14740 [Clostridium botulinum]|uniref:Spo0E like sporulation regulatory protein n=2 Tax=Clostridium TaxID=1485 RepID=A0ABU1EIK2_9CLOT|nr:MULTISPECIES: hypothetical protein [unclassified Clostridium]MDR5588229.1 hypothetical protein [Clostridium sp. 5N-1]NFG62667.1 hypothetical protein [Clostridium botulinum]NFQ10783.1 hypothetical protein [Clostridium botulinum]
MGYNGIDIIDKAINIEERRKIIINSVVNENTNNPAVKVIAKVLSNQLDAMIKHYEELRNEVSNTELEEIDIMTYDKMSFLINEFNNKLYNPKVNNVREYLEFSLNLAKDKYSLFVDIQGRLVNNTKDTQPKTYEILSNIIKTISKQIRTIEKTLI